MGKIQQTLETQHGLKHLRAIPDRHCKATLELTAAESDPLTEFFNSALRMPGEPLNSRAHCLVNRRSLLEAI
jgi:hypothetical protein